LEGHSDADALTHAVVDAVLGAAGKGDIGVHFRNTDPRWKNADSQMFLQTAAALVREDGWEVSNVDIAVVAEMPKVMPQAVKICETLARSLGIPASRVNLKATTNEKLGAIGRGEGLAAFAVATLTR
jgi:2-C-methyl-D-erythritol 2,4-cyclodiphosphate synthase